MTSVLDSADALKAINGQSASSLGLEAWFEVQRFLTEEARRLDDREFEAWLTLLADDVHYSMPIVTNRTGRDIGKELVPIESLAHFEEDRTSLLNRARRLGTGLAWAESPPSRTRRLVANISVSAGPVDGELAVRSSFILYRSHLEYDVEIFAGCRKDILRRTPDGLKIARRVILLDQSVVTQKSLGLFF